MPINIAFKIYIFYSLGNAIKHDKYDKAFWLDTNIIIIYLFNIKVYIKTISIDCPNFIMTTKIYYLKKRNHRNEFNVKLIYL